MEKEKSRFGFLPIIRNTKWDYFRDNDQPVSVLSNGAKYCGKVKEINYKDVRLQPSLVPNASGTKLFLVDEPVFVPFNSIVGPIAEDSLEAYAESWNKEKLKEEERKAKKPAS